MSTASTPIVYKTTHQVRFADLDPYHHMNTEHYGGYFMEHRMCGLRENVGWDLKTLGTLPFAIWIRRMEIDFLRPVVGDQQITITSFVREFRGPDAHVECTMVDGAGKTSSRCLMIVCCVDKTTMRPMDWPPDQMVRFFESAPTA
jgi:acyl-CoA thioester hydrolase